MSISESYLRTLHKKSSRTTMASFLNGAVRILTNGDITSHTDYDWSGLSYEDVNDVIYELTEKGRSPQTINTYLSALKGIAQDLRNKKCISEDELKLITKIKGKRGSHKNKGRSLSVTELNKLIDLCLYKDNPKSLRDAVMMTLLYGAGLRRSEITTLNISDYEENGGKIRIIGKGNKARIIKLNERAIDMLNNWLDLRGRYAGVLFVRINKGGNLTKSPLSGQAVYNLVVERYKEAGLKRLSPHDLRHSFATNLLMNGTGISVIQELMGHEDIQTTSIYTHISDKQKDDASSQLPF